MAHSPPANMTLRMRLEMRRRRARLPSSESAGRARPLYRRCEAFSFALLGIRSADGREDGEVRCGENGRNSL